MNKPIKANILKVYGRDPATLDELAECVMAVINSQAPVPVVGFAWDINYHEMVPNSHSSPEGLPDNFRNQDHLPKGYPGFSGRVWIRYGEEPESFGSDAFRRTLTHPGTGGFGSYSGPWTAIGTARFQRYGHRQIPDAYPEINYYSWDYRIYLADWPALEQWVEQQQILSTLSGKPWQTSHKFNWTDPATLAADAEFMAECATIKAKETA
jgi:hypothetical protein